MSLVYLENLEFSFSPDKSVLKKINLTLNPGEILGIMGGNGAGKTTLARILSRELAPTGGSLRWDSIDLRVSMVPQHPLFVPEFTLEENLLVGREKTPLFLPLSKTARRSELTQVAATLGFTLEMNRRAGIAPSSQIQKAALTGALLEDPQLLILDEPTAALPPAEAQVLLNSLRLRAEAGLSCVLVTHRLEEAQEVCDRILVLRDGAVGGILERSQFSPRALAQLITGPEPISSPRGKSPVPSREDLLVVRGLTLGPLENPQLDGVSFSLAQGEILGLAGLREEGLEALEDVLSGLRSWGSGEVILGGQPLSPGNPRQARSLGLGYVPADRLGRGSVPRASLLENLMAHQVDNLSTRGFLSHQTLTPFFEKTQELLGFEGIPHQRLEELSGGNLQRLILSRELEKEPRLLLLSEPSWGLDLGGKRLLYDLVRDLRDKNRAIIILSSDLGELLDLSDRIGVLSRGRLGPLKPGSEWTFSSLDKALLGVNL